MKTSPLLVACVAAVLAACHSESAKDNSPAPGTSGGQIVIPEGSPQLASLSIERAQTCEQATLHLNGRLMWDDDVTVRVFTPFAGRVSRINVELGQSVALGTPLALIASPDFGQAQAEARKAAADLLQAERTAARLRELFDHGAAPRKDLQAAEGDLARAQSEQQRTAARLALYGGATETIDQVYRLKTPLAGVVVEKNINPGQEVRPDQMLAGLPQLAAPLFTISDPGRLWIQLDAGETELPKLKPGQTFTVRSRATPNQSFTGTIEVISDFIDPVTRTVKVRGRVPNPDRWLKAEMFVTVELSGRPDPGTDVAAQAVYLKGEKHFLFLEEAPGKFARREVKVGAEHDGKVLVVEGLRAGERVVTNGCLLLEQLLQSTGT